MGTSKRFCSSFQCREGFSTGGMTSVKRLQELWAKTSPLARRLALFALLNCVILNLALPSLSVYTRGSYDTTLTNTRAFFPLEAYADSWGPMRAALWHVHSAGRNLLYSTIFFQHKIKFQYPPTALLLFEPLRWFPYADLTSDHVLNLLSWVLAAATAVLVARILAAGFRNAGPVPFGGLLGIQLAPVAVLMALTFYPLVRSFRVGQIQTWIDFLFAATVYAWIGGRERLAGACCAFICLIKPQLGLLFLWALLRRRWSFAAGWTGVTLPLLAVSLWMYGLENHLDYLRVVSYIGKHGESFYPNQSVNGLLNRMLFNGNNLSWDAHSFAPYNQWVYLGTTLSSFFFVVSALFWKRHGNHQVQLTDLSIAALSFTMAPPVAWTHHYGIMLPIFALALPATLASRLGASGLALLAGSYVLSSNYFQFTNHLAGTSLNFVQSYLFFGAVLLLICLYRLRNAQSLEQLRQSPRRAA